MGNSFSAARRGLGGKSTTKHSDTPLKMVLVVCRGGFLVFLAVFFIGKWDGGRYRTVICVRQEKSRKWARQVLILGLGSLPCGALVRILERLQLPAAFRQCFAG